MNNILDETTKNKIIAQMEKRELGRGFEYVIKGKEYKYLLSILVLIGKDDTHYLEQLNDYLPEFAEKIYVRTIPDGKMLKGNIDIIESNGNYIFADYHYDGKRPFHFSYAMNAAKSIANGEWVFKVDCDERLIKYQFDDLIKALETYKDDDTTGGLSVWVCGVNNDLIFQQSEQVRIIKNKQKYFWQGGGHETPILSIEKYQDKIYQTNLMVHHVGYEVSDQEMQYKTLRNIKSMLLEPELALQDNRIMELLIRDSAVNYTIRKGIKL